MKLLRLPRRLSFLSLLVGVVFGCCLISLVNQSQHLFYQEYAVISNVQNEIKQSNEIGVKSYPNQVVVDEKGRDLGDQVRVLCWILTSPENHETRALAVKETWGKRCNILLFMSSANDSALPSVELAVREGRNGLWGKTREAFRYAWDRYQDEVDWFLKADDDTYVIVENLRYFLSAFNTSQPLWFGHKFKAIVKSGYFSGGAGYVLSKEATRRFVKEGYFNALLCRHDHEGAEDAEMGKCMENLKVLTMDTRDSKGRGRFHPFIPDNVYFPGNITQDYWYWKNIYYAPKKGRECCSDSTISFHYVDTKMMRLLDFFLYQIRPYGIDDQRPNTPEPPPDLDLTASPWFAPNVTTTVSPQDSSHPPNSSTEVERSQRMHKQLLDYLLDQLKVYGIVDPKSTPQSTHNTNSSSIHNPDGSVLEGTVNPQQMEYLKDYVMQQLEPFGIVDPNETIIPASPVTTTSAVIPRINSISHRPAPESIVDSQQQMQRLSDDVTGRLQPFDKIDVNQPNLIASPTNNEVVKNTVDIDARNLLLQMLRSLEKTQ